MPAYHAAMIAFDTDPGRYRHWRPSYEGPVATLMLDVQEEGGLDPGYRLKLNSYDLGVDIELHDALNRIRFEHPETRVVVLTSGKERVFCSGANIYMLGRTSHVQKVNFCKFTNETRNGIEDSSAHSGLKFIAAVNGACAGGGYELALACDEIVMVDDRSSTISLPEVPLLGVLPGTGGLTRLVDKRKVRRDLADVFCTTAEGVRAERARSWNLVDWTAPPARFSAQVAERAAALAARSDRPADAKGVALTPLERRIDADGYHYRRVEVLISRDERVATVIVTGPRREDLPGDLPGIIAAGADWWPLAMARELDDALLLLRANEPALGTLVLKTAGELAPGARLRCGDYRASRSLVCARNDRAAAPHLAAVRRDLAQSVRRHRRRVVLCRRPVRIGARRRPQLHAGGGTAHRARCAQFRRSRNGHRTDPAGDPLQRRAERRLSAPRRWMPPRRSIAALSPLPRTRSIGRMKSVSRSRSAPACRPTP